jgi:DNA-binding GntR family transcriptional regulator
MNRPTDDLRIHEAPATLRALAVDRLRGAIIAGRFAGGARLVERTLCDQLGVSRSVVREVIRTLEAEGLVDTSGRAGPVVARPLEGGGAGAASGGLAGLKSACFRI